jgi:hypothetical protein
MDLAGFDKLSVWRLLGVYFCELALAFDSSARRTREPLLFAAVAFCRPNTCCGCTLEALNELVLGYGDNVPFACLLDIYHTSLDVAVVCLAYAAEKLQALTVPLLGNLGVVHVAPMVGNWNCFGRLEPVS